MGESKIKAGTRVVGQFTGRVVDVESRTRTQMGVTGPPPTPEHILVIWTTAGEELPYALWEHPRDLIRFPLGDSRRVPRG